MSQEHEGSGIFGALTRRIFGSRASGDGQAESDIEEKHQGGDLHSVHESQNDSGASEDTGTGPRLTPSDKLQRSEDYQEEYESPDRDLLSSHAVDFTPTASPASTRAGSPDVHSGSPDPRPFRDSPPEGLPARSLQNDLNAIGMSKADVSSPESYTMQMPAKQGLAIKTRPAIAAASPTTDIIDGLLGEVVQNRLAGKDTPEQAARSSRLHSGQERISLMEGSKSGEMRVLSPEQGIQEVDKPPQEATIAVISPKQPDATVRSSPFSDAKAAEALGDWADADQGSHSTDSFTVASLTLPDSSVPADPAAMAEAGSSELPPFIRRSEENLQLIVGEAPGEFELHAPEGRRFSFSTSDMRQSPRAARTFEMAEIGKEDKDDAYLKMAREAILSSMELDEEEVAAAQALASKGSGIRSPRGNGAEDPGVSSIDLDMAERGVSPRADATLNRKRDREPEGPFVEHRPNLINPKRSALDASPGMPSFAYERDAQSDVIPEADEVPSKAEQLIRDGLGVADPSGSHAVLTPSEAQIAQAKAMAGGKVDAVTGHSTLEAEEIGLPRNSADLMEGISGSASYSPGLKKVPESQAAERQQGDPSADVSLPPIISEPRTGVAIPEGSVVPPAIFNETPGARTGTAPVAKSPDSPESGLRVNVPSQNQSEPSAPSREIGSDSASTPSRPYHVETPGRILDNSAQDPPVDLRHFDSAAANIRRAAEAAGALHMVPILEQQNARLREQYAPAPSPAVPVSSDSSGSAMTREPLVTGPAQTASSASQGIRQSESSDGPAAGASPASTAVPEHVAPAEISNAHQPSQVAGIASGQEQLLSSRNHPEPGPPQSSSAGLRHPVDLTDVIRAGGAGSEPTFRQGVPVSPSKAAPDSPSISYEAGSSLKEAGGPNTRTADTLRSEPAKQHEAPVHQDSQAAEIEYEASPSNGHSAIPASVLYEAPDPDYEAKTLDQAPFQGREASPPGIRSGSHQQGISVAAPTRSRQIEYEVLAGPSHQQHGQAVGSRPVVYEDMEYEEVFREPEPSNPASPLLRPGAPPKAEKEAKEAAKFDTRVQSGLDPIEVEPEVEIIDAEPPTPHAPELVRTSPFQESVAVQSSADQIKLQSPRLSLLSSSGKSVPRQADDDLDTTGSNDFDTYIDNEARADSARNPPEVRLSTGSRPSSNLPTVHKLEGSGDLPQEQAELGKVIEGAKHGSPTINLEAAQTLNIGASPRARELQATPPPGYSPSKPSDAVLSNIIEMPPQPLASNQRAAVTQAPVEEGIVAVKAEQEPALLPASIQRSAVDNVTGINEVKPKELKAGSVVPEAQSPVSPAGVGKEARKVKEQQQGPVKTPAVLLDTPGSQSSVPTAHQPMLSALASKNSSPRVTPPASPRTPAQRAQERNKTTKRKMSCFACFAGQGGVKD